MPDEPPTTITLIGGGDDDASAGVISISRTWHKRTSSTGEIINDFMGPGDV